MSLHRISSIAFFMIAATITGGAKVQQRTQVAVIVNKLNPVGNIEMVQLRRLILGEVRQWANQRRVTIVHRDPQSAAYQMSLDVVVHMTAGEYRRFLLNQEFRGGEPIGSKTLNSAKSACEFVYNVPGAIAVVEAESALTPQCSYLVKVLTVDNKLPGEANYSLQ